MPTKQVVEKEIDNKEPKTTRKRSINKKPPEDRKTPVETPETHHVNDTGDMLNELRTAPNVSAMRFTYKGIDFIALDTINNGILAITADILNERMRFSDNEEVGSNDWRKSSIRKKLNGDFLSKFNQIDLIPIVSDLTADTGEDNYGICEDYIALPSDIILRKYNKIIPEYPTWIWSITPWAINYSTMSAVSARTQNKTIYSEKPNRELGVAIVCIFKRDAINL